MLLRRGHHIAANALAEKINHIIRKVQSETLSDVTSRSTRKLWATVHSKYSNNVDTTSTSITADKLNEFFASISSGSPPDPGIYQSSAPRTSSDVTEYRIEKMLKQTRRTSACWDGLPSWLFRKCSLELAPVVTHLVNFSLNLGQIPDMRRTAIVTPIPKVSQPTNCGDYRPISVTPIMSRIVEKIVVRTWLRPSIPAELLTNQYGFKPTGSTTAALIHLFHSITRMLESCSYVRALVIDFTKAFDIVDHTVIMSKLAKLQLPGNIYNWIGAFLSNRDQICHYRGFVSKSNTCNRGFVQGSGLGPTLLVVLTLDLNTVSNYNVIVKFADDSTLLVPENSDVGVEMSSTMYKNGLAIIP